MNEVAAPAAGCGALAGILSPAIRPSAGDAAVFAAGGVAGARPLGTMTAEGGRSTAGAFGFAFGAAAAGAAAGLPAAGLAAPLPRPGAASTATAAGGTDFRPRE